MEKKPIYFLQEPLAVQLSTLTEQYSNMMVENTTENSTHTHDPSLDEFVIENGVLKKYTGQSADVVIPDTVTQIERNVFRDCGEKVSTVTISKCVEKIDSAVFMICIGLKHISVDPDNPCFSSEGGILYNRDKTKLICCPRKSTYSNYIIRDGVREIGDYAFFWCTNLTDVIVPRTVVSIGNASFCACSNLTNITIPDTIQHIAAYAFLDCSRLTRVKLSDSIKLESNSFPDSVKISYKIHMENFIIKNGVLKKYIGNQSVVKIPEGITAITGETFKGCDQVEKIQISNSVQNIDIASFMFCPKLRDIKVLEKNLYFSSHNGILYNKNQTDLLYCPQEAIMGKYTIQEGVKYIGSYAFFNCKMIFALEIPSSVTVISNSAFSGCSMLETVEISDAVKTIGSKAFHKCNHLKNISLSTTIQTADDSFDKETKIQYESPKKDFLIDENGVLTRYVGQDKIVIIPQGVVSIGARAFQYNWAVHTVTIPDSVTTIFNDAFGYCTALTYITIPSSVKMIGMRAFQQCSSLVNITFSSGLRAIGWNAFQNCRNLVSIKIPETVKEIVGSTFVNCPILTNVYVSRKTKIKMGAFRKCPVKKIIPYDEQ